MTDVQSKARPGPDFFTVKRIAERWDSSEKHVRRLISKGTLPACKFGSMLRVDADDLLAYERSQRIGQR